MKAIIINVKERRVYEVETPGTLKDLQAVVGGFIELVRIQDGEDLYVNEEGLLHGEQDFFQWKGAAQPFAGSGVIVGSNDEGETVGTKLTADWVRAQVEFLRIEEGIEPEVRFIDADGVIGELR